MGRCLIVANQTLGGEQLKAAVRERIERGESSFHVLVPMTPPHHERGWSGGVIAYEGMSTDEARRWCEEDDRRREELKQEARTRAEQRLAQMVEHIEASGGEVEGTVCDADPLVAVKEVSGNGSFDEIVISTLPHRLSHWLRMDLPSRVSRVAGAPVTTIEARD